MTVYFLDTSAAAKLYVVERGTDWLTSIADPLARNELIIGRLTVVEIAAALYRRAKAGLLSRAQTASAMASLRRDMELTYQVVEFDQAVSHAALKMAERHGLRGYDCVQLATAVALRDLRNLDDLPQLEFVSSDSELNEAAATEHLRVIDPNGYN